MILVSTLIVAIFTKIIGFAVASSYQLTYDSIVSFESFQKVGESNASQKQRASYATFLAHNVSERLGYGISDQALSNSGKNNVKFDIKCYPQLSSYDMETSSSSSQSEDETTVTGTNCLVHHRSPGFSFAFKTLVYRTEESNYNDSETPYAIMVDANISTTSKNNDAMTRDLLVKAVSVIDDTISSSSTDDKEGSFWDIQERHTPSIKGKKHDLDRLKIATSPLASVDNQILSNKGVVDKSRVFSNAGSNHQKSKLSINIWEYTSIESNDIHRDLFLDSSLRVTTSAFGKAHAEAFVHPALIAHPAPKRIVIFSDMPVAYVREILKYRDVTDIFIVGANMEAVNMVKYYMKELNDCSSIEKVNDTCMEDTRINIIETDVVEWLENMIKLCEGGDSDTDCRYDSDKTQCATPPLFDVVLVDVFSNEQAKNRLSKDFFKKLTGITAFDSMFIFNAGMAPSTDGISYYKERDEFIESISYNEDEKFESMVLLVYDEPEAKPLNTAFITILNQFSESYYRYVRMTPVALDLDIVRRFHRQPLPPTTFYDGTTHLRYLRPSRVWENWFCTSSIFKKSLECKWFFEDWFDQDKHDFKTEVKRDDIKGRSLYAAEDIPKGSFILADDAHNHLYMDAHHWDALEKFIEDFPDAKLYKQLRDFFIIYGFQNESISMSGWSVSIATNNTFSNHACTDEQELSGAFPFTRDPNVREDINWNFSMLFARRPQVAMVTGALKDIKKGDEIMIDYSGFRGDYPDPKYLEFLEGMCSTSKGLVDAADGGVPKDSCVDSDTCV